ncbi:hypothetical protein QR685DRAFT_467304 [Neurospora intermedia]|uniref:Questionable protein n=1 Tax=Neurospora intermedia TaxID=5142 RepID=A0ABR3DTF3_NEUIN
MYLGFAFLAEGNIQVDKPCMQCTHRRRLGLNGSGPQRPDVSNTVYRRNCGSVCCRRSIARRPDFCRFLIVFQNFRSRQNSRTLHYTRFRSRFQNTLRKLHTGACGEWTKKHRDHDLSGKPGIRDPNVPDGPGMLVQPNKVKFWNRCAPS